MAAPIVKPIPRVIDLSHYNLVETMDGARELGIWGVIHKATEGVTISDKKLPARRFMSAQVGMLFGMYHFIRPGDPIAQARHFLSVADPAPGDLLALDWEDNRVSPSAARKWLEHVEAHAHTAIIYSGAAAKELLSGTDNYFSSHRLWLSQYGFRPTVQASWKIWGFWLWQFTGDGTGPQPHNIEGMTIPGNKGMDINHYGGTRAQLEKEWAEK